MSELRFCYRIAKEANFAHDIETGFQAEAYAQLKMDAKKPPETKEDYDKFHVKFGHSLAKQHDFNPDWIIPITVEEYDRENDES